MKRIWAFLLLVVIAGVATPAAAVINRVQMATDLAGQCASKRFTPDEYLRAVATLTQETNDIAKVKNASQILQDRFFELQDFIKNIHMCRLDDQFKRYVQSAKGSCFQLIYADAGIRDGMVEAANYGWNVSRDYRTNLYKGLWPAIDSCWATLTRNCIDMRDRGKVHEVASVLEVVGRAGYPRDRLRPSISACSSTVPRCRRGEAQVDCENYMTELGDILFFGQDLTGLLPP